MRKFYWVAIVLFGLATLLNLIVGHWETASMAAVLTLTIFCLEQRRQEVARLRAELAKWEDDADIYPGRNK